MFGKGGLVETNAEVVGVAPGSGAMAQRTLVYTLRISLPDGASVNVESQLQRPTSNYGPFAASVGEFIPVLCDPKNPAKFKVDWKAMRARGDEFKSEVAAESARQAREGESSDPKQDLIRLSIIQAKRAGRVDEVERLTAMLTDDGS